MSAGACGSWATSCATELLVVDRERALVGSANLTHRARQHNLEAGVLIADPDVAHALDAHIRTLMRDRLLARII